MQVIGHIKHDAVRVEVLGFVARSHADILDSAMEFAAGRLHVGARCHHIVGQEAHMVRADELAAAVVGFGFFSLVGR